MDPMTLGLSAASAGLSLVSGIGARNSAAKQGRLQMMEDARQRAENLANEAAMAAENVKIRDEVNAHRERLGRELLTIEERTTVADNSWQTTQGGVDLMGFMAAGEMAGFNPVTWLNSGALSLFAHSTTRNGGEVTTTRTGHNAAEAFKIMMPDAVYRTAVMGSPSQIPKVPDMLEVFGNAGQAGLSTFKDLYKTDKSQAFQTSLLDRQLSAIAQRTQGGGVLSSSTTYGPAVTAGGRTGGSGMLSTNKNDNPATSLPYPASWERGDVEVTNPHQKWSVDKTQANAENVSDRYGDIAEEIWGLNNVIHDVVLNATGKTIAEWGVEARKYYNSWKRPDMNAAPYVPPGMPQGLAYPSWARP